MRLQRELMARVQKAAKAVRCGSASTACPDQRLEELVGPIDVGGARVYTDYLSYRTKTTDCYTIEAWPRELNVRQVDSGMPIFLLKRTLGHTRVVLPWVEFPQ